MIASNDHQLSEQEEALAPASQTLLADEPGLLADEWSDGDDGDPDGETEEANAWGVRLEDEKHSLLSLVRNMEAEFLCTGDGLGSLAQQLNEIKKEWQTLIELTLSQGEDAAVPFAFQLLKKAEDLVLASYEQYDHVFATFSKLQHQLSLLSKQRDNLLTALVPLKFITISCRIEAIRHPAEVQRPFFTLADNVNRTVKEVHITMERQFEELAASERTARGVMGRIFAAIQERRKAVKSTLKASRQQLCDMGEMLTKSGAGATDMTRRNQAVASHISEIVMAQQCQDITRQRIEHVGEAMDEMRTHLQEDAPVAPSLGSEARRFIFQAGQIQLQQVQNVFDQLNHAAGSLKSGIQNLRDEASAAAELAVRLGGATLNAKVARQCQGGIGEVLDIVKEAIQTIAEIIAAFEPFQSSFVDCTGQATALAVDVRLAGLNAQLFAIHAPNGATLEVLAKRMRTLSEDVIHEVAKMGEELNHTSELINNLRQRMEDFQMLGQAEEDVLTNDSAVSLRKLAELESAIPVQIQRVTQQQETFSQSVAEVLAKIQFPATVAAASKRSIGFFHDLVAWGDADGSESVVETASLQKIDRLKAKYTMESERHAHTAALQPALLSADDPALSTSTSENLGDNVELF
jgi:hypothetical protein